MVEQRSQPGWVQVMLVAIVVVGVVLGAVVLTSLLPVGVQEAIFQTPLLIAVLIVGTGWLLWRISRPHPEPDGGTSHEDADIGSSE